MVHSGRGIGRALEREHEGWREGDQCEQVAYQVRETLSREAQPARHLRYARGVDLMRMLSGAGWAESMWVREESKKGGCGMREGVR